MRTKQITLYKFDELSDKAKEKARDWYRSCDDQYWQESVYDDASRIAKILGISINDRPYKTLGGETKYEPCIYWSGFSSQGDGACFEGTYSYAKGSVKKIRDYAPQDKTLHQIADGLYEIQKRRRFQVWAKVTHSGRDCHSLCTEFETEGLHDNDDAGYSELKSLLREFMDWIYDQLEKEHDYQMSDECVDDNITANEYEFLKNGERA